MNVSAQGAMIESSTTTVTRKQQDYVISGNQIVEDTREGVEAPRFTQPLPGNTNVEENSTVR